MSDGVEICPQCQRPYGVFESPFTEFGRSWLGYSGTCEHCSTTYTGVVQKEYYTIKAKEDARRWHVRIINEDGEAISTGFSELFGFTDLDIARKDALDLVGRGYGTGYIIFEDNNAIETYQGARN